MSALELVLERVASAGVDLRETGENRWRGDCVACGGEDRLTVTFDLNERVWINSWGATCGERAVLEALQIPKEALYPKKAPARVDSRGAHEAKAEAVRWLIPGYVPLGAVSLIAGDPKLGKSTLSIRYAADVTRGAFEAKPAPVLMISAEDSFANVMKPRAAAAGANLELVRELFIVDEHGERYPNLPEDVGLIEQEVRTRLARALVIDPLNAFLSGSVDSWKDHGIRRALAPLARLADDLMIAVIVIVHLNKQRGNDPLYRIGGSIGQVGAARSVLAFGRDPEDPDGDRGNRRLLGHLAANWGTLAPTRLYEIEGVTVELDGTQLDTSRLKFIRETEQTAAEAFSAREREERGGDAEELILELLGDREPHPSREIKTEAAKELDVSVRTVERAASRLLKRGEVRSIPAGTSSGPGKVSRSTEWQLSPDIRLAGLSHDNPITQRVVTEENPVVERDPQSRHAQSRHQMQWGDATDAANGYRPLTKDEKWDRLREIEKRALEEDEA